MGLVDFMRQYNGNRVVDWMNMDVERAELGILRALHRTQNC